MQQCEEIIELWLSSLRIEPAKINLIPPLHNYITMIQQMIARPETQSIHPPSLPHHLLAQVQTLQQQIIAQIESGSTSIPSQQNLPLSNPNSNNKSLKIKLRELGLIKQELVHKLNSIVVQEREIKALSQKIQNSNLRNKLEKSVIAEEDKKKIASIKKSQKQFQNMMRNKISRIMEKVKQKELEESTEKMFKNDMKRKQRLIKLSQKRAKLAESRSKTLQILKNSRLDIKTSQYTYIKNQLRDRKMKEQRQRIHELILKQKKQKQKIDFDFIRQSAIQHDRIISQKRQDFLFQLKQSEIRKRTKTVTYQSQFSRKLKSQEKMKQIERERQDEAKRQIRERALNYQSIVDEKYKPKITQQSVFVPKKSVQILDQLSYTEAKQKGNQFLKIARKKAKRRMELNESKIEISSDKIGPSQSFPTSTSEKYPNYLIQLKKRNKQKNVFERILKEKRLSSRKVEEVIRWMQKKQESNNIGPQKSGIKKNQYSLALQKIQILNSMYENESF